MKRNVSDHRGRHIAILEFYLINFGADGGVVVVGAVVGVTMDGIDRSAVDEGRDAVEIDSADAHWGVRARRHFHFNDAGDVRAGGARGGDEIGVAFFGVGETGEECSFFAWSESDGAEL